MSDGAPGKARQVRVARATLKMCRYTGKEHTWIWRASKVLIAEILGLRWTDRRRQSLNTTKHRSGACYHKSLWPFGTAINTVVVVGKKLGKSPHTPRCAPRLGGAFIDETRHAQDQNLGSCGQTYAGQDAGREGTAAFGHQTGMKRCSTACIRRYQPFELTEVDDMAPVDAAKWISKSWLQLLIPG
jgi:hypothetical protein